MRYGTQNQSHWEASLLRGVRVYESRLGQTEELVASYVSEIQRAVTGPDGDCLFNCTGTSVRDQGTNLYLIAMDVPDREPRFMGGLQCSERPDHIYFKGAIVAPAFRGMRLLTALVAYANGREWQLNDLPHRCVVRIFGDLGLNLSSSRAFECNGFQAVGLERHQIRNDAFDAHLAATADEQGGFWSLKYEAAGPTADHLIKL